MSDKEFDFTKAGLKIAGKTIYGATQIRINKKYRLPRKVKKRMYRNYGNALKSGRVIVHPPPGAGTIEDFNKMLRYFESLKPL